jgi:hypothetical protein
MTLLQPSDIPSRTGINNAITSEIGEHADTADTLGEHYDSGWTDIPLRAGYAAMGETPRYRRIGRAVYLRGRVGISGGGNFAANVQVVVGDIPANFRPNPLVMFAVAGATGSASGGRFWVDTSGQLNMQPQNATSNMSVACTYLNN